MPSIKKQLLLPRPLSWSSLHLLETDERRWVAKYLEGKEVNFNNSGIRFGKKFAERLEGKKDIESENEAEEVEFAAITKAIIHYEKPEMPLSCVFHSEDGDIPLIGSADTAMLDLSAFRERKTGRVRWTQQKAQEHGQMHFYAFEIFLITKKIPKAHLDWLETEESFGVVSFTGLVRPFEVIITPVDIINMKRRILKAARRIDYLVRQQTKKL